MLNRNCAIQSKKAIWLKPFARERTVTSQTAPEIAVPVGEPVPGGIAKLPWIGWMNKTGARVHRFFRGTSRKPAETRGRKGESGIDSSMAFKVPRTWQWSQSAGRWGWSLEGIPWSGDPHNRCRFEPARPRWSTMVGTGTKLWTVMKIAQNHRTPQLRFGAAWAARRIWGSGVGHADDDPKWWNGFERDRCGLRISTVG